MMFECGDPGGRGSLWVQGAEESGIRIIRAWLRANGLSGFCHFLPVDRSNLRKPGIAFGFEVDFGDLKAVGAGHLSN